MLRFNFFLLVRLLLLELIYCFLSFFVVLFSLWFYFGEGAGASSPVAQFWGNVGSIFIMVPPLVYNTFKSYKSYPINFLTYSIASVILVGLFMGFHFV